MTLSLPTGPMPCQLLGGEDSVEALTQAVVHKRGSQAGAHRVAAWVQGRAAKVRVWLRSRGKTVLAP